MRPRTRCPCRTWLRLAVALTALLAAATGCKREETDFSLCEWLPRAEVTYPVGSEVQIESVKTTQGQRLGILAAAPSRIRFPEVILPAGARLQFAAGIPEPLGRYRHLAIESVTFVVSIESEGSVRELWSRTANPSDRSWPEAVVDLSPYAGTRSRLLFETRCSDMHRSLAAFLGLRLTPSPDVAMPLMDVDRDLPEEARATQDDLLPMQDVKEWWIDVPAKGTLQVSASVTGVVPFALRETYASLAVWVDGTLVLTERLSGAVGGFERELPLGNLAGRRVEVCAVIDSEIGPLSSWRKLRVVRPVAPVPSSASSPILVLVADTLRADRLGAYGYTIETSPHFDRLSRQGILASSVSSSSPWTLPSVASLMTGMYPCDRRGFVSHRVPFSATTLAEAAYRLGMSTMAVVANPLLEARSGYDQGFTTFLSAPRASAVTVVDIFADWMRRHHGESWFAYLQTMDTHDPYRPPQKNAWLCSPRKTLRRVDSGALMQAIATQGSKFAPEDLATLGSLYDGEISSWDEQVGRLLAVLNKSDARQPVIAITADHGEEFMEHGILKHGKQLYQELLHVPLLICDGSPPRLDTNPQELRHLLQVLLRVRPSNEGHRIAAGAAIGRPVANPLSVSDGTWKCIATGKDRELYRLDADPGELQNLATSRPDECERLLAGAARIWKRAQARSTAPSDKAVDGEVRRRLLSLGYLP